MTLPAWHDAFISLLLGDPEPQSALSGGTEHFPLPDRQQVYRNNYRMGLLSCLQKVFERCHAHVGEDYFAQLARSYITANPPTPSGLNGYGETFPQHLEQLAREHEELAQLPWLPDLARLDWLCELAYHAPDRQPWPAQAFTHLSPQQQLQARLIPSPDCHLLASPWALSRLWALHAGQQDSLDTSQLAQPEYLLICRRQYRTHLETLPEGTYRLLQDVSSGYTLQKLADAFPTDIRHLPELISNGWVHQFAMGGNDA